MQCRSGRRSAKAGSILLEAGFTKVYNLAGGILAWDEANLATVNGVMVMPN
jgi:rhodanese-related sulfurtransferase